MKKTMFLVCKCNICTKPVIVLPHTANRVIVARRNADEMRYVHKNCNVSRSLGNKDRHDNKVTASTKSHVVMRVSFDVETPKESGVYLDMNCFLRTGNHFKSFDFDNIQSESKVLYGFNKRFGNLTNFHITSSHLDIIVKNTNNEHVTYCLQLLRKYETLLEKHNGTETKTVRNVKEKLVYMANIE